MKLTVNFDFKDIDNTVAIDIGLNILRSLVVGLDTSLVLVNKSGRASLDFWPWQDSSSRDSADFLNQLMPQELVLDQELSKLFLYPSEHEDWEVALDHLRFGQVLEHPLFLASLCDPFDLTLDTVNDTAFTLGLFFHEHGEDLSTQRKLYQFFSCSEFYDLFSGNYEAQMSCRLGMFVGRLTMWCNQQLARQWRGKKTPKVVTKRIAGHQI